MLFRSRKFNFYHGLAVSLLLHSSFALPIYFSLSSLSPPQHRRSKLQIELYGMITERQLEEIRKGSDVTRHGRRAAAPSVARQQVVKANPKEPEKEKTVAMDSPVHVAKADDKPKTTEQEMQASAASPPSVSSTVGREVEQKQQTIKFDNQDANRNKAKAYLAKLRKRIQGNLIYPEEARKIGVSAVPTIAFTITESGDIKGGTLRILKSSGYAALDSNAVKSALASAPFEKPSREINVSIAVSFDVTTTRSRAMTAVLR